jgi:hypothetical protein
MLMPTGGPADTGTGTNAATIHISATAATFTFLGRDWEHSTQFVFIVVPRKLSQPLRDAQSPLPSDHTPDLQRLSRLKSHIAGAAALALHVMRKDQ